jgi:aspartyl-tRNA(Asn)/glutamyl-tRNA(Gln) amidotransferase subunit A
MNLLNESISSLSKKLKTKEVSPTELIKESLANSRKHNQLTNSYITILDDDQVLARAKDIKLTTPLSGLPYVLKDSYLTKNIKTTSASNILSNYMMPL